MREKGWEEVGYKNVRAYKMKKLLGFVAVAARKAKPINMRLLEKRQGDMSVIACILETERFVQPRVCGWVDPQLQVGYI